MNKLSMLSVDINKCDKFLREDNLDTIKDFIEEMIAKYGGEIDCFCENLNSRSPIRMYEEININDAFKDLRRIKGILENHKENIKIGFTKSNGSSTIVNNFQPSNSNNVDISLEQTINNINKISDDIISSKDKEELEDRIIALESIINTGDEKKIESRLIKLFNFALEKGPVALSLASDAVSLLKDKILPFFIK